MKKLSLVLSCEHATNVVPAAFAYLFPKQAAVDLDSHQGWDPGALLIARYLEKSLGASLHIYPYTRLLIEPNRSPGHSQLFSKYSQPLSDSVKQYLEMTYYKPYRQQVQRAIERLVAAGHSVLHLSVHSFTPDFFGVKRAVEVGLLYDEVRVNETRFCQAWKNELEKENPSLDVRSNEPYAGADDGFTTFLRTCFSDDEYLGIELEVSQKFVSGDLETMAVHLSSCLRRTLDSFLINS